MGEARRSASRVKLFTGLLAADVNAFTAAKEPLTRAFGRIDFESPVWDFAHTGYYEEEMGRPLKRKFFGFEKCVSMKNIYKAKLRTNLMEKRFSRSGRRTVNIDPGYLDLSKVVLFSTKDYSHRIYLGGGVYAEVTLFYKDKTFNTWPWTYPDYKTKEYIDMFNSMREDYKRKVSN